MSNVSWQQQLRNKRLQTGRTISTNLANNAAGNHGLSSPLNSEPSEDHLRQAVVSVSQTSTQKTTFMRWVNVQLAGVTACTPMTSIEKDLRDGKRLVALMEVVSKEPLKPERGNTRIHQMANVAKALGVLEKKMKEPLKQIGNEDIVDGNVKRTLGLIWYIVYHYQIQEMANSMREMYPALIEEMNSAQQEGEDSGFVTIGNIRLKKKSPSNQQLDAKQAMLRWVRFELEDYSDVIPPMQDFHRSWRTGVAFAALIHRHDPTFIPDFYTSILQVPHETMDQWRATLTRTFDIAFEKMSIPRLLDPSDLVDMEPDERSLMTYISEYYLVMSKHQQQEDVTLAEGLHALRVKAKEERIALASEDHQSALRRAQEDDERKKREEEEELERIRLKRQEIEGWSIRAAERAREEEEARKKRKEEEEEKAQQRQWRRDQREREQAQQLLKEQQEAARIHRRASSVADLSSVLAMSGLGDIASRIKSLPPMDPEELERRRVELDEKLELYMQQSGEFLEYLQRHDRDFPETPENTTEPLDRTRDVDPFKLAVEQSEQRRDRRLGEVARLYTERDELLDFEQPELTAEQQADVENRWKEIDALWNSLRDRTDKAKDVLQMMQWVVDCAQEIERILSDVQRFEEQLKAAVEKRSNDTLRDRSQEALLDHQSMNLVSIRTLLTSYTKILSSLLDSNTHAAPEHLKQRKSELHDERIPNLNSGLDEAQHCIANDRLLMAFISTFDLSESWLQKSAEWIATLNAPKFVSEDVWVGGGTVKEYLARDPSQDEDLEQAQVEVKELKQKLEQEQVKLTEFRSNELAKLDLDAQAAIQAMEETKDRTAEESTRAVNDMVQEVKADVAKVEEKLPREMERCNYAMRVLEYLFAVRATLSLLESAFHAVDGWVITQPGAEVEAAVCDVEASHRQLEATYKADDIQPVIWDSIQIRHTALTTLIKDLRSSFDEKHDVLKADQQMKEFLQVTQNCQTTLRAFRAKLYGDAPFQGFITEDPTSFNEYSAMVTSVGQSFDVFEVEDYAVYQVVSSKMSAGASAPGSRQDPALVQNKIASVLRLVNDIKALRADRERDIVTITECRRVAALLRTHNVELESLESRFSAFEILDADRRETLNALIERASQLANELVLLEQGNVYRFITKDPSCAAMLKEIKEHHSHIQQAQTRLQSGLEVGEQWMLLWDQFTDRVQFLQQYLEDTEKVILGRGVATMDGLANNNRWKKNEEELHEIEAANNTVHSSLKEFQRQRMLELSNIRVALYQAVQLTGGIDTLDQIRTQQYHEAEQHQQRLREHLQRLYLLISQEGFQLEILGQRLVWSQQLETSKTQADASTCACQGLVEEYANLVAKSCETNDSSELSPKNSEQMKQRLDQITTTAATQRETTYDVTLTIFTSLSELATTASPGKTDAQEKKVPAHLEVELHEFKERYIRLECHLDYTRKAIGHAIQTIEYIRRIDAMDNGFLRLAAEFKAEKEASHKALEKLDSVRAELEELTAALPGKVQVPTPAEKVLAAYPADHQPDQVGLEKLLTAKLERSRQLSLALDPLLEEFRALLVYQDGLRRLSGELKTHDDWIAQSNRKIQITHDQIKQMFKSWPMDEHEQMRYREQEMMVVFDVDEEILVDDLGVLMEDMDNELAHVAVKKVGYLETKKKVHLALESATVHSKQLQMELEWHVDNIARKIEQLVTDIKDKTRRLQALEKRAIWEKEIEMARSWFRDFAKAVIIFAREQVKWRSNHREFDDTASLRSVRTTASRIVIDRLGASVIEFEEQVENFETESRPRVDKAWSELCSSLVFIARSIPDDFQRRHLALFSEFEAIREQVLYSAQIVTQRKSLEQVALRLEEMGGMEDLESSGISIRSGRVDTPDLYHYNNSFSRPTSPSPVSPTPVINKTFKTKAGKAFGKFGAKVKKLAKK